MGSASAEPTIEYSRVALLLVSLRVTRAPIETVSVETCSVSTTRALRSFCSSDWMRYSSCACSFLASSYSEFSEMSPNSRASLMRSATSRRFVVERYSISSLSLRSPLR